MDTIINLTAEELNLLAAFRMETKQQTLDMMQEMSELLAHTMKKVASMTEEELAGLDIEPATEDMDDA